MVFQPPPNRFGAQQRRPGAQQPQVVELPEEGYSEARPYDYKMTALGGGVRAARSIAEDIRDGKPLNATKATIAAVGEQNYNAGKAVVDTGKKLIKGGKKGMKLVTTGKDEPTPDPRSGGSSGGKRPGKRGRRGRGKGGNKGGGGDNSRMYTGNASGGNPTNKLSSVTPYAVTLPGSPIDLLTINDPSLYYLPYGSQNGKASDFDNLDWGICTNRTTLRIISLEDIWNFNSTGPIGYTNQLLIDSSYKIFAELKMEVNANTNGGNTVTNSTFTYDNFWAYISVACQGHALLSELDSRMTWSPSVNESNFCIRDLKNMLTADPDLFVARNRLRDQMSTMALPKKLMDYYMKIFAPYKKSPVEGGAVQMYMSTHLAYDLGTMTTGVATTSFANTKNEIDALVATMRSNINQYTQITALLMEKTNYDYVSQRYRMGALDYPCYDVVQNGIFNNLPFSFKLGDGSRFYAFGGTQVANGVPADPVIALPMDTGNVPIYLTAHLSTLYRGGVSGDFPFWSESTTTFTDFDPLTYSTNMVMQTDPTSSNTYGFLLVAENAAQFQATDHMVTIVAPKVPADFASAQINLIPKGLNVRRYQPSFESLSTASSQLMMTVFGVDL